MGYAKGTCNLYIIYELMSRGDLHNAVHCGHEENKFSDLTLVSALRDVTLALQYLHSIGGVNGMCIVHRDVKPANILFDGEGKAKLADLGFAHLTKSNGRDDSVLALTEGYADPEYKQSGRCFPRNDVYSMGITILETLTGLFPISKKEHAEHAELYPGVSPGRVKPFDALRTLDDPVLFAEEFHKLIDVRVAGRITDSDLIRELACVAATCIGRPTCRPGANSLAASLSVSVTKCQAKAVAAGIARVQQVAAQMPTRGRQERRRIMLKVVKNDSSFFTIDDADGKCKTLVALFEEAQKKRNAVSQDPTMERNTGFPARLTVLDKDSSPTRVYFEAPTPDDTKTIDDVHELQNGDVLTDQRRDGHINCINVH